MKLSFSPGKVKEEKGEGQDDRKEDRKVMKRMKIREEPRRREKEQSISCEPRKRSLFLSTLLRSDHSDLQEANE